MKLIKEIGVKQEAKRGYMWALFECPKCGNHIERRKHQGIVQEQCQDCFREYHRKTQIKHGDRCARLYRTWINMRARCFNKKDEKYHIYGGRGIVPTSSSISSHIPEKKNRTILFPISRISSTSQESFPGTKTIRCPVLTFFPGLTIVSHVSMDTLFRRRISTAAPESSLCPSSLAGMTLVLLMTRQSPSCSKSGSCENIKCCVSPVFPSSVSSRDIPLIAGGCWAICSSGN